MLLRPSLLIMFVRKWHGRTLLRISLLVMFESGRTLLRISLLDMFESGRTLLGLFLLVMFVREWQNTPQAFLARHVWPRVAEHSSICPCSSCCPRVAEHSPVCPCSSSLSESGKTLLRLSLLLMFFRECQNTPRAFPARHVCPRVAEHSSVYPCQVCPRVAERLDFLLIVFV